jgi:hypothetical protein
MPPRSGCYLIFTTEAYRCRAHLGKQEPNLAGTGRPGYACSARSSPSPAVVRPSCRQSRTMSPASILAPRREQPHRDHEAGGQRHRRSANRLSRSAAGPGRGQARIPPQRPSPGLPLVPHDPPPLRRPGGRRRRERTPRPQSLVVLVAVVGDGAHSSAVRQTADHTVIGAQPLRPPPRSG